jgi:hypothetical protein
MVQQVAQLLSSQVSRGLQLRYTCPAAPQYRASVVKTLLSQGMAACLQLLPGGLTRMLNSPSSG